MNKTHIIAIQVALLAGGAYATKKLSKSMFDEGQLNPQPNVLHLKRSPFGRTLALAMRGPVDVYWHRGAPHLDGEHDCEGCTEDHEHGPDCEHHHEECDHDHHGEEQGAASDALMAELQRLAAPTEEDHGAGSDQEATEEEGGLRNTLLGRIESMRQAYYSRTNTHADTRMHKAFIMGETQKRLKISYEMDPTNIAGYGAYFLFLSEALARVEGGENDEGVVQHRRQAALELAHYTIAYCLNFTDEAPAMMTAANASHDFLQIYLSRPEADLQLAGEFLQTLDSCLIQYEKLRREMKEDGRWEKYSIHRINELESAYALVRKLRDLDHEVYSRLTGEAPAAPANPES